MTFINEVSQVKLLLMPKKDLEAKMTSRRSGVFIF